MLPGSNVKVRESSSIILCLFLKLCLAFLGRGKGEMVQSVLSNS